MNYFFFSKSLLSYSLVILSSLFINIHCLLHYSQIYIFLMLKKNPLFNLNYSLTCQILSWIFISSFVSLFLPFSLSYSPYPLLKISTHSMFQVPHHHLLISQILIVLFVFYHCTRNDLRSLYFPFNK
jgi:hypothetical protein